MTATDDSGQATIPGRLDHRIMHAEVARELFGARAGVVPTVGRFVVLDQVGSGGMGKVYRAYDPELDRRIALKVLLPSAARPSAGTQRLRREAMALARLSHPNVVTVHEVGVWSDEVFVAMEFVEGEDLARRSNRDEPRGPQRRAALLEIMLQAGRGLAAAHSAGLVHRDFKPGNVLVGSDGRVRVADFGLARSADDRGLGIESTAHDDDASSGSATTTGTVLGTPRYMAPEQRSGRELDARADQFSFCVTAWEVLFDAHPFARPDRPVPPTSPAGAPAALVAALQRGLEADPARRFATMDELLAALVPAPVSDRRAFVVGVVATVGVAAVVGSFVGGVFDGAPCEGAGDRIAEVWGPEREAELQQAVLATELPFADATWTAVAATLAGYSEAWRSGYEDACSATEVRREQTAEMMNLRMACLAERRRALVAFTDLLAEADAKVVETATMAALKLPPVELCAEPDYVLHGFEPLDDASSQAESTRIRDALASARALDLAGEYAREGELLASVLPAAETLDHPPLSAELALQRGILAGNAKEPDAAEHLLQAYVLAVDADLTRVAVEAAGQLSRALVRSQLDDAERWLAVAGGGVDDLVEPLTRARYEGWKANVAFFDGRLEDALAGHDAALAALEHELGPDDPRLVDPLLDAALIEQTTGRYDAADARLRRALAIRAAVVGPDHPDVAAVHVLLGAQALRLEDNPAAEREFTRALDIRRRSYPDDPSLSQCILGLGIAVRRQGRLDDALAHYREGARIIDASGLSKSQERAYVDDVLSEGLVAIGRYDEAAQHAEASLALRRELADEGHPSLGESLHGLARARAAQGRHDEALDLYRRAHDIFAATLGPSAQQAGWANDGMAEQLVELRRLDEADAAVQQQLATLEANVGAGHRLTLRPLTLAGRIAELRGELGQARARYESALATIAAGSDPDDPRAMEALFGLARVLLAQGDAAGAVVRAERALALEADQDPNVAAEIRELLERARAATSR